MPTAEQSGRLGAETLMFSDRGAVTVAGSWLIGLYHQNKPGIAFAPVPRGPEGRKSMFNGLADSIWTGTDQPEAAWKWVQFLGSDACQSIVAESAVVFPAREKQIDTAIAAYRKKGIDVSAFIDVARPEYEELNDAFEKASDIISGHSSTKTAEVSLNPESNSVEVKLPSARSVALQEGRGAAFFTSRIQDAGLEASIQEDIDQVVHELSLIDSRDSQDSVSGKIVDIDLDATPVNVTKLQGCSNRQDCFPYFRGGLDIRNVTWRDPVSGLEPACTAGFNARSGPHHYVITAGHCGEVGDRFRQSGGGGRHLGYMDHRYDDHRDAGRIKVEGPWRATRWVYATAGFQSIAIVGTAHRDHPRRAVACFSGITNGYRCGRIEATKVTTGGLENFWRADFDTDPGDSGGPVFLPGRGESPTNVLAYGIVRGDREEWWEPKTYGPQIKDVEGQLGVTVVTN